MKSGFTANTPKHKTNYANRIQPLYAKVFCWHTGAQCQESISTANERKDQG